MKRARLLAGLVIALALVESALGLVGPRRAATTADWQAAAAHVRAAFKTGDAIVFAPGWIDQTGRMHLGDLIPVEVAARSDVDRHARVWELSVRGATSAEAAACTKDPLAPCKIEEHAFGRVRVRRIEKPAVTIARDLTTDFANARVTTRPRGAGAEAERPCTVDGTARLCGTLRVEPRVLEIDYRPRRGVLVPATSGETTIVAYDEVPGGTLVGYVGLHDYYARKSADGVVMFRVRVDEHQSLVIPVRNPSKDGEGWQRFELPLAPGTHQVRVEIDAERPVFRLPGFHLEVRAP